VKFRVRDHFPQYPSSAPRVNEDHGVRDSLPEAQQLAWEVAVGRGFDPERLRWSRYTVTTWGLMLKTATGFNYCYVGIEAED
jgi:hypothetical protein